MDDVQIHLVDDVDTAQQMLRWLSTTTRFALDTETTGLHPETDRIRLVQLGDQKQAFVIPVERWGGVFLEAITKYDGEIVMHNAKFDTAMVRSTFGVQLPRHKIHDTMPMAHILDANHSVALKALASLYVDRRAAVMQRELDEALKASKWTWATVPLDFQPYWTYAGIDTVLTARLFDVLYPKVQTDAPIAYELERATIWALERMERNGARIDPVYTRQRRDEFAEYVSSAEHWCLENYGIKPGSNASVVKILSEAGYTFDKVTKTGATALDKEVLGGIDHPLAQTVLQRRRVQKLASTYLDNFLTMSYHDGRVHPSYNGKPEQNAGTYGALTGRMSMSDPNLQNLPRHSDTNPLAQTVRNCIIPSDGNLLVLSDFDQIEMRIIAHLAGDRGMIEALQNPTLDMFTVMAREIFQDPELSRQDERRQMTKNGAYAKSYGAGAAKFAQTIGVTEEQGTAFYQVFDQRYPGMRIVQDRCTSTARQRAEAEGLAYVRSPLTQRRHVPAKGDKEYVLFNYLVQGMAAEILKMKDIELSQAGLDDYMILNVHDEVILDVPCDEVPSVVATIDSIMNDTELLTVPITASCSTGKRWGEKKAWLPGT